MEIKIPDELTLELVRKLRDGEKISTSDVVDVLRSAGVNNTVVEYIADLHARKVEGKTSTPATAAEIFNQVYGSFKAVSDELDRGYRNGEKISMTEAIKRAAKRAGVAPSTMRRHLQQTGSKW